MLLVIGGLRGLFVLLSISVIGALFDIGFIGIIALIEIVAAIAAAILQVTGGVFVLQRRYKGYTFGVAGSGIAIASRILDFIVVATAAGGIGAFAGGYAIGIVFLLVDIAIIVLLVQNKDALTAA
jgi:hypothetical protein